MALRYHSELKRTSASLACQAYCKDCWQSNTDHASFAPSATVACLWEPKTHAKPEGMGSALISSPKGRRFLLVTYSQWKERKGVMAKSLDELLRLKGVIASGEFSPNGKLIDFRSNNNPLSDEVANFTAQVAAAVSQLLGAWLRHIPKSVGSIGCRSTDGRIGWGDNHCGRRQSRRLRQNWRRLTSISCLKR